jgi:hypothetical protein
MVVPPIPVPAAVHPNAALLAAALAAVPAAAALWRLVLRFQWQSMPLSSNRLSLRHTINSQPNLRPCKKALQMGMQRWTHKYSWARIYESGNTKRFNFI